MQRPTLTNIQILRFIAAGAVLTKHSLVLFLPGNALLAIPWSAGVDLFFVISGFIMAWLTRDWFGRPGASGQFLLRRAIRIIPPYWFFTSLMVATLLIAPDAPRHTRFAIGPAIASYAFFPWPRPSDGGVWPLLAQGWTLNYEAFFYVCFALALLYARGKAILAITFVVLSALWFFIPERIFVAYFYCDPIILEFLIGILLEQLYHRGLRLPLWGSLLSAGIAIILYVGINAIDPLAVLRVTSFGIPAAFLAAAFIFAPEPAHIGPAVRALRFGGDASYTLYLSHPFIVSGLLIALPWLGLADPALGTVLAIATALAFALIFYAAVERPVTQALHRYFGFGRQSEAQMVAP